MLFALGIRFVGATVAEKLASYFGTMDALQNASFEELTAVPEIGEKIALSIRAYFADQDNLAMLSRLRAAGLKFENDEVKQEKESDRLAGKTFVISGVFQHFERDELKMKIEANGGKVLSGVSGKLNYLLAGANMGPSKLEKAQKLGVTILSEEDFLAMLE